MAQTEYLADPSNLPNSPELWSLNASQELWVDSLVQGPATKATAVWGNGTATASRQLTSGSAPSAYMNRAASQSAGACVAGDLETLGPYHNIPYLRSLSVTQVRPGESITLYRSFPETSRTHQLRLVSATGTFTSSITSTSISQTQATAVVNVAIGQYDVLSMS